MLQPIEEGDKVRAEIVHILDDENIRVCLLTRKNVFQYIHEHGKWPTKFEHEAEKIISRSKGKPVNNTLIDSDLLPPSESEDEEDDQEISDDDEEIESKIAA